MGFPKLSMKEFPNIYSRIQKILNHNGVELHLLREDELHSTISGNKFRKLKYNIQAFKDGNFKALLTFGGAYSNHIVATAAAGKEFGFQTIGVIRGEELVDKINENPSLSFAKSCGMKFKFIDRTTYRNKNDKDFIRELKNEFGDVYIIPEGGSNKLAVKGCEEILYESTDAFDFICTSVGTAGTMSGIVRSSKDHQKILGFPALKNANFLNDEIKKFTDKQNFQLIQDYHFGGYAKFSDELIEFINNFKRQYNVTLDPIYTGKMIFGLFQMIESNQFENGQKILAVHTGGLQGIHGFNQLLKKKNKSTIE